jgi:hypothetical protein
MEHGAEDDTWESTESVLNQWKRDDAFRNKAERKRGAEAAMEEARNNGIEPFHFREVMSNK